MISTIPLATIDMHILQTITFIHTLMANQKRTKIRTALIVCPLNTVLNWQNEWNIWFNDSNGVEVSTNQMTTVNI